MAFSDRIQAGRSSGGGPVMSDARIRQDFDPGSYERGRAYARQGRVRSLEWNAGELTLSGVVAGNSRSPYVTEVELDMAPQGGHEMIDNWCSCPLGGYCKHAVALLLTARVDPTTTPQAPTWRRAFDAALSMSATAAPPLEAALQFELIVNKTAHQSAAPAFRLAIRPVTRGKSGKWIRSEISWRDLAYAAVTHKVDPQQLQVLVGIQSLRTASRGMQYYYGQSDTVMYVDELKGSGIWSLLDQAEHSGLTLINAAKDGAPIQRTKSTEASLDISRDENGLVVAPTISVDGTPLTGDRFALIGGTEASGLYWWTEDDAEQPSSKNRLVKVARFDTPLDASLTTLVAAGMPVRLPADDADEFLLGYYPKLAGRMTVRSPDGSVQLPGLPEPSLMLSLHPGAEHSLGLQLHWSYRAVHGDQIRSSDLPLMPAAGEQTYRDDDREAQILSTVRPLLVPHGLLAPRSDAAMLTGTQAAEFVMTTLPLLRDLADVEIDIAGDLPDYRQALEDPVVSLATTASPGSRDWFDLSVTVTIEGEDVPIDQLLAAIVHRQPVFILPSGICLSLDHPVLQQLLALIEEARALQDVPSGPLRLSRFQVGLWSELEALGVVTEQAEQWCKAVSTLRGLESASDDESADMEVPTGVHAELRPYQRSGFAWLSRLHSAGLGGILADDMGLGKTLQVLALIEQLHEHEPDGQPFLVVAPTSVAGNWLAEAARFTPDLRVTVIDQTRARRGEEITAIASRSDIVITSYTLMRLEFDGYDEIEWAGLVLDEAQFVKNHQSKTYGCAKRLRAGIKIAVTGTPLENNLMELWALLGLVAPGLFPSPKKFTDYYRTPIERNGDAERLAQLHRRLRPLMLRRAKHDVALDLPAKQEQIISVELAAKHRVVYDRHLNRERQKVLGLMEDFDGNRFEIFRSLMLLRRLSLDASLIDEAYVGVPASKLDVLADLLDEAIGEGHRVLVFSQFTGVLGRIRDRLDTQGVEHCYLDGTTKRRTQVIDRFRDGTAPVFLISLKAGGFGLNLTEADYCILVDPWWNPAVEAQAVDRIHRIGQNRAVMVYRLVAKDTIEEKVMALKAGKAKLFDSVIGDAELATGKLTPADIRGLLE